MGKTRPTDAGLRQLPESASCKKGVATKEKDLLKEKVSQKTPIREDSWRSENSVSISRWGASSPRCEKRGGDHAIKQRGSNRERDLTGARRFHHAGQ